MRSGWDGCSYIKYVTKKGIRFHRRRQLLPSRPPVAVTLYVLQLRLGVLCCDYAWTGSVARTTKTPKQKTKKISSTPTKDWRTNRTAGFLLRKMPPPPISRSRLFPSLSRHQEDTKRNEKRGDKTRASYIQHKWALSAKKEKQARDKKKTGHERDNRWAVPPVVTKLSTGGKHESWRSSIRRPEK